MKPNKLSRADRWVFGLFFLMAWPAFAVESSAISHVSVSRPFFNPTLGQKIQISLETMSPGMVTVQILDRDGYLVRALVGGETVVAGKSSFDWDGRDSGGQIVPDEAYSVKIDFEGPDGKATYLPLREPPSMVAATTNYYDRRAGIFSYKLPRAARVHVQAGALARNPKTKAREGPVLKTLVNREPRPAGSVVESWNGFDEGGSFAVPELPGFSMAVAATSLPENSILTTGNRARSFLERAATRKGEPVFKPVVADRRHHGGLTTLEDVAPKLTATPASATWSDTGKIWTTRAQSLEVSLSLSGPSAAVFSHQPGKLFVYLDQKRIREMRRPAPGEPARVSISQLMPGRHNVAINWASDYGPVAVDSLVLTVGETAMSKNALHQ